MSLHSKPIRPAIPRDTPGNAEYIFMEAGGDMKKIRWIAVGLVLVVLCGAGVWVWRQRRPDAVPADPPVSSQEPVYSESPVSSKAHIGVWADIYAVSDLLSHVMPDFCIRETRVQDIEKKLYVLTWDDSRQQDILDYVVSKGYETDFIVFGHMD